MSGVHVHSHPTVNPSAMPQPGGPVPATPPSTTAPDSYFTESRKGEVNELRLLLRGFSTERDTNRKRDIIKKVIGYMTLGIDVSRLFTEMMLAIETRDLVIKKMVYLFLCNYATSHPDLAQMCTNTLQKDCGNEDPMVRGLALRALCSLRLPEMVEYISEPLRKSLKDNHAYVRKTGVMGILKLYHLDVDAFERCNFVDILYEMLRDPDASVVVNCILVLNEIMAGGEDGGMAINRPIILHLLNRIGEFSEFGIVTVLDLLPRYRPLNDEEAYQIMNLLDPILKTSNSAAVLSTIRVFLGLTTLINGGKDVKELRNQVAVRIKAPIVTHVTSGIPELVYCLLKHIDALIAMSPGIFDDEYRQFYVKFSDPTNIQYLKVQILPKLTNANNAQDIISELSEYVSDSDDNLSRLAVKALSHIACNNAGGPGCEEGIVLRLVEMLDLDVGHVPSESATALGEVLRKHPDLQQLVAHRLPRALRYITEPTGKSSVVHLLGETGLNVKDAPYALEKLIDQYDTIKDENVKISLLTATMKLFFKRPPECQKMLGRLLKKATEDISNQDLHDRALLYYRLLKTDPKIAESTVGGTDTNIPVNKPFAEDDNDATREAILKEFNSLSIVYGKTQEHFVAKENQTKFVIMPEYTAQTDLGHENLGGAVAPPAVTEFEQPPTVMGTVSEPTTHTYGLEPTPAPVVPQGMVPDLLDFGTPSPVTATQSQVPPTPPALTFNPQVTMNGDTYQTMWSSHPDALTASVALQYQPSTSDVESALGTVNVLTMASGELPSELKFFLYCQETQTDSMFLIQAVVSKQAPMVLSVVVKTDATNGREKAALLWEKIVSSLQRFI